MHNFDLNLKAICAKLELQRFHEDEYTIMDKWNHEFNKAKEKTTLSAGNYTNQTQQEDF